MTSCVTDDTNMLCFWTRRLQLHSGTRAREPELRCVTRHAMRCFARCARWRTKISAKFSVPVSSPPPGGLSPDPVVWGSTDPPGGSKMGGPGGWTLFLLTWTHIFRPTSPPENLHRGGSPVGGSFLDPKFRPPKFFAAAPKFSEIFFATFFRDFFSPKFLYYINFWGS